MNSRGGWLGLACMLLLSGCATTFSMRSLPAETPAADNAAAIKKVQQFMAEQAAAAAAAKSAQPADSTDIGPPLTAADVPSMRTGVHNFFANLAEVVSVVNYAVQLRPAPGVRSLGRFVINSTIGIGGLFDVATPLHLPDAPTTFGATLARWGVNPGPYLVVPLLGPSTLRDGTGFVADYGIAYWIDILHLYRGTVAWVLTPINAVDIRANTSFRYYSTDSPFEYDTVRFLYVRKTLIEDDRIRLWHRSGPPDPQAPAGR
jgi:hypothetical protein